MKIQCQICKKSIKGVSWVVAWVWFNNHICTSTIKTKEELDEYRNYQFTG